MLVEERTAWSRGFRAEECTQCGKCLAGCHYGDFTPEQAKATMEQVTRQPQWYPELAACIRCGKCDHRCPKDAHPSDLTRECLSYKRCAEDKIPSSVAYAINGLATEGWGANFFQDVYKDLPKVDRAILRNWAAPKTAKDLLWIGCTDRLLPRTLEESPALRNLAKFGGPDDCCGVWGTQGGFPDEGYRITQRWLNRLKENRFERLVVACGHCQKVLTKIVPELFGYEVPFPIISIYEYFLELIEKGQSRVANPLNIDAAISDSCFGCENGDHYLDVLRETARNVGMSVSELPHNREDSLCCGYNGLFTDGKIANFVRTQLVKRRDMKASGKKHIISYCPGCHLFNHYFQPGFKSHYLLEDVLFALDGRVGEPFSVFYRRMGPRVLGGLTRVAPTALSPRRPMGK